MKTLILAILIGTTALFGQVDGEPAEAPEFPPALVEFLNLSADQVAAIEAANQEHNEYLKSLRPIRQEWRRQLNEALKDDPLNAGQIGQLMVNLETQNREVRAKRKELEETLQELLDADQQNRLRALVRAERLMPVFRQAEKVRLVHYTKPKRPNPEE